MRRLLALVIILSMLQGSMPLGPASVQAQGSRVAGCRYFPATGHNVLGEFLSFFDRYNGEVLFGQPRTEALAQDGMTVQYFERVRMELHPSNPPQYRVQLTLLGDLLGYRQGPISAESIPPFNHPHRRYYPQTGHTLSYGFMQYYDMHGGLDVFGYPISEMMNYNGLAIQYFQRGKMEWHPENAASSQVTLGTLGNEYIVRTGVSQQSLAAVGSACSSNTSISLSTVPMATPTPVPPPPAGATPVAQGVTTPSNPQPPPPGPQPTVLPPVQPPTDFSVTAAVKRRITGQGGTQTLYVRAQDAQGRGVADATVNAIVHYQSGDVSVPGRTDGAGSCTLTFDIGFPPPGYTVMIEVQVTHGGRTVVARTSFMVWS